MTLYDARMALEKSAWRLEVDLVKLDALSHAKMPLDDVLRDYTVHLSEHRALLSERL